MQTTASVRRLSVQRVSDYLLSRGDTFGLTAEVDDGFLPEYQGRGIDIVWYYSGPDGVSPHTITVTGDRFDIEAVFLEYENDWGAVPVMTSDAEYLFYFVLTSHKLITMRYAVLRDWLQGYSLTMKSVAVKRGETYRSSVGVFVPTVDLLHMPKITTQTI